MATEAFCRVSAALIKASRPQTQTMLDPPFDTNGNVTPVSGRKSAMPNTFKIVCVTMTVTAAQAPMV